MKKSIFYFCYLHRYAVEQAKGKELLPLYEQVIKYAAADGLDGIEILPEYQLVEEGGLDYAKKLKDLLDSEGVVCSCVSRGISALPDVKEAIKHLKYAVDLTKILGAPFLHHTFQGTFNMNDLPKDLTVYHNAEKHFVEMAREVAYYAGEQGLDCIYEDQGFFVNSPERLGELIHKIDMYNIGVCLDVGNSLFYDIPAEAFAGQFAPIIKHVHIKDYIKSEAASCPGRDWDRTISGNWLKNCLPGTGIVNLEKIFNILLSAGYDGFYSLENQDSVYNHSQEWADMEIGEAFNNVQHIYDRAAASLRC